ncbi:MAG: hypothetical protein M3162_03815 [Thermoproteota archaeon]|nr:hypothetical protein [Thermoproteota archaeon]
MNSVPSFFDAESETLYHELPRGNSSKIKITFSLDFDVGQSYVTSKIEDRDGHMRNLNIQGGKRGIRIQKDLVRLKNYDADLPPFVYAKTFLKDSRLLIRKLPVDGISDWLLIFEDDLFVLAVKGMYDEIELLG